MYDEDKTLFSLCGKVLGSHIEQCAISSQLNKSDSILQIAFDCIKQPLVAVNRKGIIVKINNFAKAFYGFTEKDMLGKSFNDLVFLLDSPVCYDDLLNTTLEINPIHDIELTHIRSDLTIVDVSISAYPFSSDDGIVSGVVFIIQDIGQQKQIKNKMIQMEKLSVLGKLLYSAANELNNSLTSVIGHSELLFHLKNKEITGIASKIHKGSLRCGSVVTGLLDLAREDEIQKGYSNIDEILKLVFNLKRYQLRSNNIHLSMEVDKNIPQVAADLHDVERIILHIINDAERRMLEYENGGKLSVEVKSNDKKVIVRFTDTGTCILKYDMDEILSRFYAPSVSSIYTDVGLVASCQILKNIGGSIHIDSQIGKNNIITIEIPAVEKVPIKVVEYENDFPVYIGAKNILLVDDEVDIIDLLTHFLQEQGYIIDVAKDGNEALEKVLVKDYDIIISDLKMPNGFTGAKLHGFVKQKNPDLAQRMIFMTGDIFSSETQRFLQIAGNQYLEKPFLPESLMEIIRQMNI
jgi:two-component system NtrC family sensor kinase